MITTEQHYKDTVDQIAAIMLQIQAKEVARDTEIQNTRDKWDNEISPLELILKVLEKDAKDFAKKNRAILLGKAKSAETPKAVWGFRWGKDTLSKPKKLSWDAVMNAMRRFKLGRFIRVKTEVDKAKLIAEATDAELEKLGLKRGKTERFYIDPKDPGAVKKETAA